MKLFTNHSSSRRERWRGTVLRARLGIQRPAGGQAGACPSIQRRPLKP